MVDISVSGSEATFAPKGRRLAALFLAVPMLVRGYTG